ncbi:T9SS type B sorting domain-containing protein [Psychroserpens damuponensis]|uniref:T9SS type B sorting domain-containing protein n=1 Tax=Psychroserpens damuponensis TaxID=943936 RepID=UPI000694632B|nr:choice-of-anchor L domain-containing protein [Psychroserpens damuponensis]
MIREYYCFFLLFFVLITGVQAQQITTDDTLPLQSLIESNFGQGCVEITNISSSINGSINGLSSYGSFDKSTSNFPFQNGILLSTGNINSAGNTINTNPLNEGGSNWGTDPDLENALALSGTINATSIEFDFISVANQIQFNYLLASEEYLGTNPCSYSDGFAFLIREANSTGPFTNIAIIPGTSVPVNTNTIHDEIVGFCPASNETFFEGYNLGDTNYNGRTTVLTATASIQPNVQYHIKLVIADQGDEFYDSAVFIEGNSFNATVDLGPDIVTCGDTVLLNGDIENNQASYEWFQNNTPIAGETNPTLEVTESGTYRVEISIVLNNTSCVIEDEVVITLDTEQEAGSISDYLICDDPSNDGVEMFDLSTKDFEVELLLPPSNYNITYHISSEDAQSGDNPLPNNYQNTTSPQQIFVRIEDVDNGCLAFTEFNLIVNEPPVLEEPTALIVCDDGVSDGITSINLDDTTNEVTNGDPNIYVSYHYSQQDANTGENPIYSPYTNINPNDTLYIRVYDATTGCSSTTFVDITVQDNPMVDTTNPQYINACDPDDGGSAEFDLTSIIQDLLDGLTGVTVTFHETSDDAQTGNNPIADPDTYQNIVPGLQEIYIRIVDEVTGCFVIVPLELFSNLPDSAFGGDTFSVCDDISADGVAQFDLNEVEFDLVNGYDEFEVIFYETEDDLTNGVNPIDKTVPYTVSTSPTTIYAFSSDGDCASESPISLVVYPPVDIQGLGDVDFCDEDTDGFTSIFLTSFNSFVSTGVNGANVKYFLTENDAINNENILEPYYYNISNPQTIWVKVTSSTTGCFDIAPLTINVTSAPTAINPTDIIICDDNQDGIFNVDLTPKITEAVSDTNNLSFTFYTDYSNAENAENEIANPTSYDTTSQYIFIRVEDTVTGCFTVVWFYAYINTEPAFIPIENFENCEADGNGIADFYFYLKDTEILNGQTGKDVLYFETSQDAIDRTNIIDKYAPFQNTTSPQTMYVRVENFSDVSCFGTSQFELEVGSLPPFNEPLDVFVCDDMSNDGFVNFDLNFKILEISEGINQTLSISFHPSQYEADQDLNEFPLDFNNYANPQQVYARIENGTYCHAIVDFDINVIQVPDVNAPSDLIQCDTDYDGFMVFDLTDVEVEILDVRQDDIIITYHESFDGAETDTEIISTPDAYTNITNPQTVFIKINNTVSNCYVTLPINLIVNIPPTVIDFQEFEICDNTLNEFDLTLIDTIVTNETGTLISYYNSLSDAEANANALSTNYTYQSSNDTIFIRLENSITGCWTTYNFDLIINPLPIANMPTTFLVCDDIINDGEESIDLSLQDSQVLGTQSNTLFSVTYYNNETNANNGNNAISNDYIATNGEIIFVRVENNETGCYDITQFDVLIYEHPQPAQPIILCDDNYDEITTFDLTVSESDLYPTLPEYITISYFENIDDLENNANPILNATSYSNTTNAQIVYIKVFNTLANCYAIVPLELIVNVPPPINQFETYEICDNPDNSFNLNTIDAIIVDDDTNVLISYFENLTSAQNSENALDTDYTYQTTNDIIFIRVEFETTTCFYIYPFELVVNTLPIANQPDPLEACDDDYDGFYNFDLTQQDGQILGNQNPNNYTITYHASINDANSNTNALVTNYDAQLNETIYVRIQNNTTGCYSVTEFITLVRPKPVVAIPDQVVCIDNLPLVVNADTTFATDTYQWSTGDISSEIEITEIGTYSVTVTSEYGCETTSTFNVTASESATIDVVETIDFSDPNNITVTIYDAIGNYLYQLDDFPPQFSNFFENVTLGYHTITIIDLNGCAEVTKEIVVIDAPKFVTPNGDGYFDTWHITGVETLPGTIVYIFDRYGKLIKTLTHNSQGWDGYYNGNLMRATDYWFLAKVKKGDINFEVKGHFTLRL